MAERHDIQVRPGGRWTRAAAVVASASLLTTGGVAAIAGAAPDGSTPAPVGGAHQDRGKVRGTVTEVGDGTLTLDLVTVVDRRLAFWRVLARQQARPLGWVRPEADGLWVPVPPEELEAAVDALLTNVFQHTPERSTCVVIVQPAGDGCRLTVEDGGDGIPDAALHRGRSGDGSTGLGLDIVRQTAERAGGRVRLGRSPAGGGRVTVSLPRAAAP